MNKIKQTKPTKPNQTKTKQVNNKIKQTKQNIPKSNKPNQQTNKNQNREK